eukprot:XP_015147353.2 beta-keratin-related protein-like [Gallus gallus]
MTMECFCPHVRHEHSIKAPAAAGSASSLRPSFSSRNEETQEVVLVQQASSTSKICCQSFQLSPELCLPQREMSCCRPCVPSPCGASGPTPLASSCSEPCVARCADSTVVIEASPVVVTLPGPILTSFPQSTAVGSSLSAAVGSSLSTAGVPISSGGSLGLGAQGCVCLARLQF